MDESTAAVVMAISAGILFLSIVIGAKQMLGETELMDNVDIAFLYLLTIALGLIALEIF